MSLARIFCPVLAFGLLMAGLTFSTNELVAPWANHRADNLIRRAVFGEVFPQVRQQVFFRGPDNRFFYVDKVDDSQRILHNVMVYEPEGAVPRLVTAQRARWDDRAWSLADGVVREFDEEGFTRYEARFASMQILVGADAGTFFAGQKTPEEMTTGELRGYLSLFGAGNVARFAVEYYRKFAVPFASVIFALVAAPLSVHGTQGGRYLGVGLSIALLFFYYAIMSTARALGGTGALPPVVAAWAPNLLFGLGGLTLWAREGRWFRHLRISQPVVNYGAFH
jgi:lipopolysaccharide export system permease protein